MAHFAKLDENNLVIAVNCVANEALDPANEEISGIDFLSNWSGGYKNWKQTSYNGKIRKQFAGVGYSYEPDADVFIAPQPYPSWLLDENYDWQPPKPFPKDGIWYWNENILDWVKESF